MPVDARINTIQTEITARDPALTDDPKLIAAIVARVLEELQRQETERNRRDADRRPSRSRER